MPLYRIVHALKRAVRVAGACALGLWINAASAQTLGSGDIQSILQGVSQAQQPAAPAQPTTLPSSTGTQTMQPATAPSAASSAPSPLENDFSTRAGVTLKQFGYDIFGAGSAVSTTQMGAVQDSYILGVGDQIQVVMVGHENATYTLTIDRDGRILLLNLPPVAAAGRTLGEVRAELSSRIAAQFLGTKSYITVAGIRQISVLVTGEVNVPGMRTVTGLNTAIDALLLSGGVKKTGSLRAIYVLRGTRRIPLDLYSIIGRGTASHLGTLTEGDRIVVPPIGSTVAITGVVQHPGIYELPPGAAHIGANALVQLAGGEELAGAKRLSKLALAPDGRITMVSLPRDGSIAKGEVLFVDFNRSSTASRVSLNGEVTVPGVHAIGGASTVADLLRDPDDLGPNAYTLFAVIVRHDPRTNFLKLVPFSIQAVFDKTQTVRLVDNDFVYVFNNTEIQALAQAASTQLYNATQSPSVQAMTAQQQATGASGTTQPGAAPAPPTSNAGTPTQPSTQTIAQMAQTAQAAAPQSNGSVPAGMPPQAGTVTAAGVAPPGSTSTAAAPQGAPVGTNSTTVMATVNPNTVNAIANRMNVTQTALTNLASDYLIWVNGEVLNPGPLLAATGANLDAALEAAGGLSRQADLSGITVTSTEIDAQRGLSRTLRNTYSQKSTDFASIQIRPFDAVSVRAVFSDRVGESITVSGQVRYPGTYEITRDERLSSVIARAGGLTDEAYAYGAVFTRQSAAAAEAQANQREAMMLNDELATLATQPAIPGQPPPNLSYLQTMASTLAHQPTLGRISIAIDPAILLAHPDRDPLLETGDALYIPKRPSTVAVTGEVLNAGAFAWRPGMSLDDYVDMAGGETDAAEDSMVFVIMPDGTAVPAHTSWWSFGGVTRIPPGATVVVPRDPQPFNLQTFLSTYTDILSKVAITAASLAVVSKQ
ncbi:MAG: SLBB domain-containing protein [Alphaproteobacteria bacterium]|nr:SLBB domain-containing protein [Alphaproteobacteria bacterium]MBV9694220.1 SLBB domain-containing protein [Alphaproteobacteria bacterium]